MKQKLKNILMVLVIVLGPLRFWADLFHLKKLDVMTFGLGLSPLPIVFSNRGGVEDFANDAFVTFNKNGREHTSKLTRDIFQNISTNQSLRAVYAIALVYSVRFPENLWMPALEDGFCQGGKLSRAFEAYNTKTFKVIIQHRERKSERWEYEVTCKD